MSVHTLPPCVYGLGSDPSITPGNSLYIPQPALHIWQCTHRHPMCMVQALITASNQLVLVGCNMGTVEIVNKPDTTMYIAQPSLHICQCTLSHPVFRVYALIPAYKPASAGWLQNLHGWKSPPTRHVYVYCTSTTAYMPVRRV